MSVLWETGLGSCIVLILGCVAATLSIVSAKKKPGAVTPGQTNN